MERNFEDNDRNAGSKYTADSSNYNRNTFQMAGNEQIMGNQSANKCK